MQKNMKKYVVASYIHSELNPASDFIFPPLIRSGPSLPQVCLNILCGRGQEV